MKKTIFRLIGLLICLLILPMVSEAQTFPGWIDNPPENTADTIYIVIVGIGETLQEAKDNAGGSIVTNTFIMTIGFFSTQFIFEVGRNEFIMDLRDPGKNWFNDNVLLIDTFSTENGDGVTYYALCALPKEAYNSMFDDLIYWYIPAFKEGSIENAVYIAANQLVQEIPQNAKVAVLSFASDDIELGEFVLEEITGYLSSAGTMNLFDRYSLDSIRQEQKFQITGDVDDKSAVSIGQFAGADIVITGSITGSGSTRRLRFKALDVKTGAISSQTSHRY
jgi:hypothetical protein